MLKKILNFTKIEHTAFSLPLLFTGAWWGAGQHWPQLHILLLILAAATGARVFGMAMNRVFDRHIDAANPRTAQRELAAGTMNVQAALTVAISGLFLYAAACAVLGGWCLVLAPLPLIPLLGYSLLKRFTPLCHFGIGLCLALAPLGAFVAAAGNPHFSIQAILFADFVFFWLSGADIIYALMDVESDRRNGIHSLPANLGPARAQQVAAVVHGAALACLAIVLLISHAARGAYVTYGLTVILFVMMYLPFIPVPYRFFPIATLAGVAGAITPMLI